MRRVSIGQLADGLAREPMLVRDVHAPGGEVLSRAGMRVTRRVAGVLREHGVTVAFIEDAACVGLTLDPVVDVHGDDAGLLRSMRDAFGVLGRKVAGLERLPTSRALERLREVGAVRALDSTGAMEALRLSAAAFAERAQRIDPASGFVTERHAVDDFHGHSLATAAIAVRLGRAVGLEPGDLTWVAIAVSLHDVGMLLVPPDVRRTPVSERTAGQRRRYEDHALLGEALLRPLAGRAPALPLVAFEHHEHQSGGGYPLGRSGVNRILRAQPPRRGGTLPPRSAAAPAVDTAQPLALVSEIVAVADRYERLVSGQPGEQPLSAAAARRIVATEAGSKWNAEVVGRFLDLVPALPVGTDVVLRGGGHEGTRGIVVGRSGERGRPVVRVYATPAGPVEPAEVDLARVAGVMVVPVDVAEAA